MRSLICAVLALVLCLGLLCAVPAAAEEEVQEAEDISSVSLITQSSGAPYLGTLFDGSTQWGQKTKENASLTLTYESGLGSLYLQFGARHGAYTLTNNDTSETIPCGEYGFLNEFLDLVELFGAAPSSVTLNFPNAEPLYELDIYTPGEVPASVQKWNAPAEDKTDLILFSTHGDDEQLFFAGLLPYYAGELGYQVQVVYLTDHHNYSGSKRMQEMLNGLWAVGVTTYPVFGEFMDYKSEYKDTVYFMFKSEGHTRDDVLEFVVEQIRRFNPLVVVGHDFEGEYGHAQHMIYAEVLAEALEISNDASYFPELAEKYGLWDVPKAYFHLYQENAIVMDWDQPLENFDGMTAFEVTQKLGFPCHVSQQNTWFTRWLTGYGTITQASQIDEYSPCEFGLYRSTVGEDVEKNDFFENLNTYAEQERIAEEERLAEEKRLAEEARIAEEEQLAEEARLAEEASLAAEETTQATAPTQAPVVQRTKISIPTIVAIGAIALLAVDLLVLIIVLIRRKK